MTPEEINHAIHNLLPPPASLSRDFQGNPFPDVPAFYYGDLNAMHRAEQTLSDDQWETYTFLLSEHGNPIHAPAAVKAEAFLKTFRRWKG